VSECKATYCTVRYVCIEAGEYLLHLRLYGEHILGSPYRVQIIAGTIPSACMGYWHASTTAPLAYARLHARIRQVRSMPPTRLLWDWLSPWQGPASHSIMHRRSRRRPHRRRRARLHPYHLLRLRNRHRLSSGWLATTTPLPSILETPTATERSASMTSRSVCTTGCSNSMARAAPRRLTIANGMTHSWRHSTTPRCRRPTTTSLSLSRISAHRTHWTPSCRTRPPCNKDHSPCRCCPTAASRSRPTSPRHASSTCTSRSATRPS